MNLKSSNLIGQLQLGMVEDLILLMKNKVQTLTHHDSVYMCSGIINTWDSFESGNNVICILISSDLEQSLFL